MSGCDTLPVGNLILRGDQVVAAESLDAAMPTPFFSGLSGHFALHLRGSDDRHVLVRDPLGVNKLFFAVRVDGDLDVSNFFIELRRRGHRHDRIWSVPSGHLTRICPSRRTLSLEKYSPLACAEDEPAAADLITHAANIRSTLEGTFRALARSVAGRPLYVTMSGGLDSTAVAVLTRELVGDFVGVTFRVEGSSPGEQARDDLHYAKTVAAALEVPLEVVTVSRQELLSFLDPVLLYGQDYRDFNVHCGLVNAAIAACMRERFGGSWTRPPVVLTGDTMNELVADYTPVTYKARRYYDLPRVSIGKLRRFLVSGLDSGDREVGIFAHYGIDTIQPYALSPQPYCALPAALLAEPQAKQQLARAVFGDRIPACIYARPKVRAQVGSSDEVGGALAALVDAGIDSDGLERRFSSLYGFNPRTDTAWIRAGFYRFTSVYPGED